MSNIPEDILTALHERRDAHTAGTPAQWEAAEEWIARTLTLARPGGVVSMVMPDGELFVAKKPRS